jgi:hypothetical protein
MSGSEFVCHAHAAMVANVFTPIVQVFCQISVLAPGLYRVSTLHNDVAAKDLKVTINAFKAGTSLNKALAPTLTPGEINVVITDDAGAAIDPELIWVTVERVPRT